jgi:hypothetical protein
MGLVPRYGSSSPYPLTHLCVVSSILINDACCSMSVVEESFEYLDAPVERIAGADVPMPYAANLERMAVPQVFFFAFHLRFSISCCIHFLKLPALPCFLCYL